MAMALRARHAVAALAVLAAGCGQKGPPLAPLRPVPSAVTEFTVRRVGDQVQLRFVLPTTNLNGPGPIELDRVEIYAVTTPPGYTPPNRDLLTKEYVIGQVAVRPAPVEGEAVTTGDARPEPGAAAVFTEQLTAAELTPITPKTPPAQPPAAAAAAAAAEAGTAVADPAAADKVAAGQAAAAAAAATVGKEPLRIYVVRGVTRSGRTGAPSPRVQVPITNTPAPPPDVAVRTVETGVVVEWVPPKEAPATVAYNIYRSDRPLEPINPSPVTVPAFEYSGATFGEQACFRLRTVATAAAATIEGDLSEEECITPRDTFPPAAPKRLDVVPTAGQISLIWDANTEKDLAGYLVLRGEGPDAMLQPLTPQPIKETSYRDTTVTPGQRYVYAIVAVDTATPANTSPQSPRVEEIAR